MNILELNDIEVRCTGCSVCADSCPHSAITLSNNKEGFLYPSIDNSLCINCGKCIKVCPLENRKLHTSEQHLYSVIAKDEGDRCCGSSGGVFGILAKYLLQNGYYVCGAAFDKMALRHLIVNSVEDLPRLLKSKYIQSCTVGVYSKICDLLKSGKKVFFCGTPCQVSALLNFAPQDCMHNLFVADFICHGVPSQSLFDMYIKTLEKKHKGTVESFEFRVKNNRYRHAHGFRYTVKVGTKVKIINGIYTKSSFYNAFKKYAIFREGCYNCEYATLDRVSDITLGDFWGIEKYQKNVNTDRGVSMVISNTEMGSKVLNAIEDKVAICEYPLQYGIDLNYCLTHRSKRTKIRDEFFDDLELLGYECAAQKHFSESFKYKLYWLVPPTIRNLLRKLRRS